MVIYLRHPEHGEKVATSQFEVDFDVQHGWEVFDPTVALPPLAENNLAIKRKRSHGKE